MLINSIYGRVAAAMAMVVVLGIPTASFASENERPLSETVVGSWNCLGTGTGGLGGLPFLSTFNEGGTYSITLPRKSMSETHGSWKRTGRHTFVSSDQSLGYGADGIANALQTVNATEEITGPNTLKANVTGVVKVIANGAVIVQFNGILNCTRIKAQ